MPVEVRTQAVLSLGHGRARARSAHRLPRPFALCARRGLARGLEGEAAAGRVRAERPPRRVRRRSGRDGRPALGPNPSRLLVRLRGGLHEHEASAALHGLGAVGRTGRIAAPLAARADGALERGDPLQSLRGERGDRMGGAGAGARRIVLRAPPRCGRLAVRHADGAARGGRAQPEPPEPVHGRAPTDALSGLRRPDDPVRLRNGRAALRPHGRALDRRHAPLDARGMGVPRHRPAARDLTGRTSRSAGAGTTPGIRSRTPR